MQRFCTMAWLKLFASIVISHLMSLSPFTSSIPFIEMKTAILTAVLLSGASFVSAETGDQVLPKDDKVKVLVRYTNSQGKFSTTLISERNVNPFDHQASLVDRIASSARPISIKGQISQVEIEGDVDGAIEALLADDEVAEVELVSLYHCLLTPNCSGMF